MQVTLAAPRGFRLRAVVQSHGWYDLAPFGWDGTRLTTVATLGGAAADVTVAGGAKLTVSAHGDGAEGAAARGELRAMVTAMLRLDEELAPLYALTDGDARLAYARNSRPTAAPRART